MAEQKKVDVVTACCDADGEPVLVINTVLADENEIALGDHYDRAARLLRNRGYQQPFVHFDEEDGPTWLLEAMRKQRVERTYMVTMERVYRQKYEKKVLAASEGEARYFATQCWPHDEVVDVKTINPEEGDDSKG